MLDTAVNFARGTVNTATGITATTVPYTKTGAQDFPDPTLLPGDFNPDVGYNIVIWDSTDYGVPSLDPNVMIFRVTGWASGTLTGYWVGQSEAIVAQATPSLIAGKTYTAILGPTAKFVTDLIRSNSTAFVRVFSDLQNQNTAPFYFIQNGGTRSSSDANTTEGSMNWTVSGSGDSLGISAGQSGVYLTGVGTLTSSPLILRARIIPWSAQGTADNADFTVFFGFAMSVNGSPLPTKESAATNCYAVGFLCDPTGTDTNPLDIQCVAENGSNTSRTVVDSGVAFGAAGPVPLTNPPYVNLEMWLYDTVCYFWINGTLVATITTNIPATPPNNANPLYLSIGATSAASGNSNSTTIDFVECIFARPNP